MKKPVSDGQPETGDVWLFQIGIQFIDSRLLDNRFRRKVPTPNATAAPVQLNKQPNTK